MATDYSIVNQRQTTTLQPGGGFTDVMEVTYRLTDGTTGVVKVPLTQYSADAVQQLVEQRVKVHNEVSAL